MAVGRSDLRRLGPHPRRLHLEQPHHPTRRPENPTPASGTRRPPDTTIGPPPTPYTKYQPSQQIRQSITATGIAHEKSRLAALPLPARAPNLVMVAADSMMQATPAATPIDRSKSTFHLAASDFSDVRSANEHITSSAERTRLPSSAGRRLRKHPQDTCAATARPTTSRNTVKVTSNTMSTAGRIGLTATMTLSDNSNSIIALAATLEFQCRHCANSWIPNSCTNTSSNVCMLSTFELAATSRTNVKYNRRPSSTSITTITY